MILTIRKKFELSGLKKEPKSTEKFLDHFITYFELLHSSLNLSTLSFINICSLKLLENLNNLRLKCNKERVNFQMKYMKKLIPKVAKQHLYMREYNSIIQCAHRCLQDKEASSKI